MALSADEVYEGLLQHNYFPSQKKGYEEIPPIFTTQDLAPHVAEKIKALETRKKGFDCVSYTSTRFDLVPRTLQIPFPKGYVDLCNCIRENWKHLEKICHGQMSAVKPAKHSDGHIIIMNYGDREESDYWHIEKSFAQKFGIRSDITNFYPSIYTHSIGWAAVGQEESKNSNGKKWYDELDRFQHLTTRKETKGVPIGPASSNIIAEFILQKIDDHFLCNHYFNDGLFYIRYIDDYQCYAKTREDAEDFVRQLRMYLTEYGLNLNTKKTHIYELPDTSENTWLSEVQSVLPHSKKINFLDAKRFLDYVVVLAKKYPGKSVLKYGMKCILKGSPIHYKDNEAYSKILGYALNLAFYYPGLITAISPEFKKSNSLFWHKHQGKLARILSEAIRNHRSDVMCWILYMACLFNHTISEDTAIKIINTKDCLSILLLYKSNQHIQKVLDFSQEYIENYKKSNPAYDIDKMWILFYHLFLDGLIKNPYNNSDVGAYKTFDILKKARVSFLRTEKTN